MSKPSIDLTGNTYGQLTVIKFHSRKEVKSGKYSYLWNCVCSCGNSTIVISGNLKSGTTKSCGCNQHPKLELTGKKFNKWTVIKKEGMRTLEVSGQGKMYWLCKCDCGKIKSVYGNSLVSGKSTSCGCKSRHIKGHAARRGVFSEYKSKCKRNNWIFVFSEEEFNDLIIKNCFYCGKEPSNIANKGGKMFGSFIYNGIDRVNNNEGYTKENVVTSCKNCNLAKRKLTTEEFFNMIKLIYERHCK